jgi:hypothetical protein
MVYNDWNPIRIHLLSPIMFMMVVGISGIVSNGPPEHDSHMPRPALCKTVLEPPAFVYLISSDEAVYVADIVPDKSAALLAFHSPLAEDILCPCCIWNVLGISQQEFLGAANQSSSSPFPRHAASNSVVATKQFFRSRLWSLAESMYRPSDTESSELDYFILVDLEASSHYGALHRDQFTLFERNLIQEQPYAAVPFHPCNTVDHDANNNAAITSVHDTSIVAVHKTASKLLLPLDEDLFSLICHTMLRGTVMQFQLDNRTAEGQSACEFSGSFHQFEMMHFVSSLLVPEFILAIPFSPRIRKPLSPPYFALSSSGEYTAAFRDNSCPVRCSFYYWSTHPTFSCCASVRISSASHRSELHFDAYDADAAYAQMAERWQLPRAHDLECEPLNTHTDTSVQGIDVTHPLPKFGIALSTRPVTLDEFCVPDAAFHLDASRLPSGFKLTLQPDQLHIETSVLDGTSTVRAKIQFVLSAPCDPDRSFWSCTSARAHHQFKAVFGSVEAMHVRTQCNGSQSDVQVDINQMQIAFATDHPHQSVRAPWFFLPSENGWRQWFEVASNASKDALRIFVVDISVPTHCDDFMFLSANASVLLREIATAGLGCGYQVVSADSHNVSFSALAEARRAFVLREDPAPKDLFHDSDETLSEQQYGDFACAGSNRDWTWDQQSLTELPRDGNAGMYNMCLFQNICWMDGELTLFLPKSLEKLSKAIPSFFDFQNLHEPESLQSLLGVNLSPMSMQDSFRTLW